MSSNIQSIAVNALLQDAAQLGEEVKTIIEDFGHVLVADEHINEENETNPITARLERNLEQLIGISKYTLLDIYRDAQVAFAAARTRGPPYKISNLDAIVCLLLVYHSGTDLVRLANRLDIATTLLERTIDRIRLILLVILQERW